MHDFKIILQKYIYLSFFFFLQDFLMYSFKTAWAVIEITLLWVILIDSNQAWTKCDLGGLVACPALHPDSWICYGLAQSCLSADLSQLLVGRWCNLA